MNDVQKQWDDVDQKYNEYVDTTHETIRLDFRNWLRAFYFAPDCKF